MSEHLPDANWEDLAREAFGENADAMIERIRKDAALELRRMRFAHSLGAKLVKLNMNSPDEVEGVFTPRDAEIVRRLYPLAVINGVPSPLLQKVVDA